MAAVIGRGLAKIAVTTAAVTTTTAAAAPTSARGTEQSQQHNAEPQLGTGLQSPFLGYYVVCFFLNGVGLLGAIFSQLSNDPHREQIDFRYRGCHRYLFFNGCFCFTHIIATIYIAHKIQKRETNTLPVEAVAEKIPVKITRMNKRTAKSPAETEPLMAVVITDSEGNSVVKKTSLKSVGPPGSWKRIRHVCCENWIVGIYVLIYISYGIWQWYLDIEYCSLGMLFVMRCADLFIGAAPIALIISIITLQKELRELEEPVTINVV